MLGKRLICLLGSINFMIAPCNINIVTPFQAMQVAEKQVDNNEVVQKLKINKHPFLTKLEKDKEELNKKKVEEEAKRQLEEQKKNQPQWQEFILTFYSSMNSENGFGAITSQGKNLSRGGVANNVIPQNTQIYLEGYGQVIVNDKGSNKHFSVDNRLDVFIERESGESDSQYARRIEKLGVQRVKGYIIK